MRNGNPRPLGYATGSEIEAMRQEDEKLYRDRHPSRFAHSRLGRLILQGKPTYIFGEPDNWWPGEPRYPMFPNFSYIEAPDSALPVPKSLTDGIDPEAVMAEWQRRADNGEFLRPGEDGYEEAQERFASDRARMIERFPSIRKLYDLIDRSGI